jgi:outer membrane autotransporter protein
MTPHLDISWQHETLGQNQSITNQFQGLGTGPFTIQTGSFSKNSALIDLGINADIKRNMKLYIDYLAQAGQGDYFGQSIQIGAKLGF